MAQYPCIFSRHCCNPSLDVDLSNKAYRCFYPGPLFLIWINFISSMGKWLHPLSCVGEVTNPFPNFNGATVEVWEWISNFIPHFIRHDKWCHPTLYWASDYLSMLGLKLNHASKWAPCHQNSLNQSRNLPRIKRIWSTTWDIFALNLLVCLLKCNITLILDRK